MSQGCWRKRWLTRQYSGLNYSNANRVWARRLSDQVSGFHCVAGVSKVHRTIVNLENFCGDSVLFILCSGPPAFCAFSTLQGKKYAKCFEIRIESVQHLFCMGWLALMNKPRKSMADTINGIRNQSELLFYFETIYWSLGHQQRSHQIYK